MATELATAYIAIVPSLQGVQGKIASELGGAGESGGRAFGAGLVGSVARFAGPLVAALGVGKAIATGFQEVKDAAAGTAQLAAGIASTGGAAGVTVKEMNDLASSIQSYSGQTDDSITKAQGLLLTFTNIKNVGPDRIFDDATRAAADMAARLGGDASGNAILLGKALNDPIKGITSLSRAGVQFTAEQKEQIKTMVEAGDTLGAQKIILGELETQFGGSAAAFGATLPGQIERVKRGFEDLTQAGIAGITPVLVPVLDLLIKGMAAVTPIVERVGAAIGTGLTSAFEALGPVFSQVAAVLGPVFASIGGVVGEVFGQLLDVVGPLIPQLVQMATTLSPIRLLFEALAPLLPQIIDTFLSLATTVGGALGEAFVTLLPAIIQLADVVGGVLSTVLAALLPVILDVAQMAGPLFADLLTLLVPLIVLVADVVGQLLEAFAPLIPPILELIPPIAELIATLLPPLVSLFSALITPILKLIVPLTDLLVPILLVVVTVLSAIVGAIVEAITWFVNLVTGSEETSKRIESTWNSILGFFGGLWNSIIGFFSKGIADVIKFFTNLPKTILSALGNLGRVLFTAGKDMIQGLLDGAASLLKNIGKFFLSIVPSWILEPFKAALGIRSPSKVFRSLGVNIGEGLVGGLGLSQGPVERAAADLLGLPEFAGRGLSSTRLGDVAAGRPASVYVQNPFTGDYLLARVSETADTRIAVADASDYATIRGGVWR